MHISYLRVALRHARKHGGFALLNLLGLSIAFTAVGLILIYLHYETRFDAFHPQADRIFRVTHHQTTPDGNSLQWARTYADFVNELPASIPEVETLIRFQNHDQKYVRIEERKFKPEHAYVTDPEVFQVFGFSLLAGEPGTALAAPHGVVLTESLARTYFGSTDPLGQTLLISNSYSTEEIPYTVTGIMADLPPNTHLPVDMLLSFGSPQERTWWAYVYILLAEGTSRSEVEAKLPDFVAQYGDEGQAERMRFVLQPLRDIHLHSHLVREIVPNGQARYVQILAFVAAFILLIGLINYLNLNSVMGMTRFREMGLRRMFGAGGPQLVAFALTEAMAYALLAAVLALVTIHAIYPWFQQLTGAHWLMPGLQLVGILVLAAFLCGLIAGLIPAFTFRAIRPLDLLQARDRIPARYERTGFPLRRMLVTLQLGLSALLISATAVAWLQVRFLNEKNLGLSQEQVVALPGIPDPVVAGFPRFQARLEETPGLRGVAACMEVPSREIRDQGPLQVQGLHSDPAQAPLVDIQVISPGFLETMGICLVAGEDRSDRTPYGEPPQFSETFTPADYLGGRARSYLINETAMRQLGWQRPEEALGQVVSWSIANFQLAPGPITGVVQDHHQESLRNRIDPTVYVFEPIWLRTFLIRLETDQIETGLAAIQAAWDALFPTYPFAYHFLDELYDRLYRSERTQLHLLLVFSGLAMLVAFIGLVGLVAWSLRRRMRELALRRVLGAGGADLVRLIGREYLLLMLLGAALAFPLSYMWARDWLSSFAYHIELSPWPYLFTLLLTLGLLGGTIGLQTLRAARTNPAARLREE
ncbi:MAG: FtsX-like permease family protein [Bacteroidetes bacterium]|nr:MAG: FtsX-like permease family protein [Bacteroidota bacterium]